MGWPGPMTHRQYLVWQEWLNQEWNRPDRSDHYAMQVAKTVAQSAAGRHGRGIKLNQFKIPFKTVVPGVKKVLTRPDGRPIGSWRSMMRARWAKSGIQVQSTGPVDK